MCYNSCKTNFSIHTHTHTAKLSCYKCPLPHIVCVPTAVGYKTDGVQSCPAGAAKLLAHIHTYTHTCTSRLSAGARRHLKTQAPKVRHHHSVVQNMLLRVAAHMQAIYTSL